MKFKKKIAYEDIANIKTKAYIKKFQALSDI